MLNSKQTNLWMGAVTIEQWIIFATMKPKAIGGL
jgi:hypothetical protein